MGYFKKIVVASDSFKGSASSADICRAVASGCRMAAPDCSIVEIPIADGGEGTIDSLAAFLKSPVTVTIRVTGPLSQPIDANYIISGNTAFIELASAAGLPLVPLEKRNPLYTTTLGVGDMIADAISKGCSHITLGIGGSATNDAGTGILHALGFRFFDCNGYILFPDGDNLAKIHDITFPESGFLKKIRSFTVLADVDNPFCGPHGAAYVYAPQKGASPAICDRLDAGMRHFSEIALDKTGIGLNTIVGGGAAGGVGASMVAFLNAGIMSGIDYLLDISEFDTAIRDADLVITGEGKLDCQSAQGKVISGIVRRCNLQNIPVVAIAGCIDGSINPLSLGLRAAYCINPPETPLATAMQTSFALHRATVTAQKIISDSRR